MSPLVRRPGTGRTLDVLGVTHSYRVMASDAGRQFSVWESIVPPGLGAPAHMHAREDKAFYVLSGEVLMVVEGTAIRYVSAPAHFSLRRVTRRHGNRNVGADTARLSACRHAAG